MDRPGHFEDTMIEGAFRFMQHDHVFRALSPDETEMRACFVLPPRCRCLDGSNLAGGHRTSGYLQMILPRGCKPPKNERKSVIPPTSTTASPLGPSLEWTKRSTVAAYWKFKIKRTLFWRGR